MDNISLRPVLRDVNSRLINPHLSRTDNKSAFKAVGRDGIFHHKHRRSSSFHDENRVFQGLISREKSVPNVSIHNFEGEKTENLVLNFKVEHYPLSNSASIKDDNDVQCTEVTHLSAEDAICVEHSHSVSEKDAMQPADRPTDCSNQTAIDFSSNSEDKCPKTSLPSCKQSSVAVVSDVGSLVAELENAVIRERVLRDELASVRQDRDRLLADANIWTARLADAEMQLSQERERCQSNALEEKKQLVCDNELLRRCVQDLELNLSDLKNKLHSSADSSSHEIELLRQQVSHLQHDVNIAYRQKTEQVEQCKKYKDAYEASLQSIQELHAQLNEYSHLQAKLQESMNVQQNLAEVVKKAHECVSTMHHQTSLERKKLTTEREYVQRQKDEYEQVLADRVSMDQRSVELTSGLNNALEKIASLELSLAGEKLERATLFESLQAKQQQADQLQHELQALNQRYNMDIENLQKTVASRDQKCDELSRCADRLQRLVVHLKNVQSKTLSELVTSQEVAQRVEAMEAELKETTEIKDLLEQERSQLVAELSTVRADLEHCHVEKCSLSSRISQLEQQCHHLEMDKDLSMSGIAKLTSDLSDLHEELLVQADHWMQLSTDASLEDNPEKVQLKVMPASDACADILHSSTTSSFVRILLNMAETRKASVQCSDSEARDENKTMMVNECSDSEAGDDNKAMVVDAGATRNKEIMSELPIDNQYVSVISPCDNTFTESVANAENEVTPSTPARSTRVEIQSTPGFSAFRSLTTSRVQRRPSLKTAAETTCSPSKKQSPLPSYLDLAVPDDQPKTDSKLPHWQDSQSDHNRSESSSGGLVDLRSTGSYDYWLNSRLNEASDLLGKVFQAMVPLQQRVTLTVSNLNAHIEKMKDNCDSLTMDLRITQEALRVSQCAVSEASDKTSRELAYVTSRNKQLETDLKQAWSDLAQRSDMTVQCYELSRNVERLKKELALRESEIISLKETITCHLNQLDSSACLAQVISENQRLKADKTSLMMNLSERRQAHVMELYQLRETHKLVDINLKRAETALCQLNDKVERVRLALRPHRETLKSDEKMLAAMTEIDVFADN